MTSWQLVVLDSSVRHSELWDFGGHSVDPSLFTRTTQYRRTSSALCRVSLPDLLQLGWYCPHEPV